MKHSLCMLILLSATLITLPAAAVESGHPEGQPITVSTAIVSEQHVPALVEVVGTLEAVERAAIAAKVSGTISAIPVVLGSRVEKGDLLVQISAEELAARLKQADAQLRQAKRNLEREQKLLAKHATTPETVKSMQDRYNLAQATYTEVDTMLGYTTITAPFTGVITGKQAHVGDLATPGRPLLRIENPTRLQVRTAVPESLVLTIHPGDLLQVNIPAAGVTTRGTVAEVAPAADPASRTAPVTLNLPAQDTLRSGQFARVLLPGAVQTGYYIPEQAIQALGQIDRVFVIKDEQVSLRLIRKGMQVDGLVEVLSGLEPGEEIVVDTTQPLINGQKVRRAQ